MKKVWLKSATLQDFAEIEIGDWIEGVGMIMSHFEKDFVRRFGSYHLTSQSSRTADARPCADCNGMPRENMCKDCKI